MKTGKIGKEAMRVSMHVRKWLEEHAPFVRNLSQHTVIGYKVSMRLYLTYLEESGIAISAMGMSHFGRAYVEGWIKWLREERGCGPCTCNLRLAAIRAFLKYAASRDPSCLAISQEVGMVPKQKAPKAKVSGISRKAIQTLMRLPDTSTRTGRRDMALLVLMYGTAARIDEILSLTVGQLNLQSEKPYVTIIGKGSKTRTIYLLPRIVAHLKAYLREYHPVPDGRRILFYSRNGDKTCKLSQQAVDKRIKLYATIGHGICPEIPLSLHAHQFRHAKATHWLEDKMNIVQICFLLGHANVQTTMRYLDITTEQEEMALATLEDEKERGLPRKWRGRENTLLALCGLQ